MHLGRFDASALHIAHALKQTEIQKSYNKAREKPIDQYLVSTALSVMFYELQIPTTNYYCLFFSQLF